MELSGATALVTGGSSGIGAATARALAAAGARVLVAGRNTTRLRAVAAETGGLAIEADLAEPDGPALLARAALCAVAAWDDAEGGRDVERSRPLGYQRVLAAAPGPRGGPTWRQHGQSVTGSASPLTVQGGAAGRGVPTRPSEAAATSTGRCPGGTPVRAASVRGVAEAVWNALAGRDPSPTTAGFPDLADCPVVPGAGGHRFPPNPIGRPGIDILINNAGVGWAGPLTEMSAATVARLVAVNLTAPIELTRLLAPTLAAGGQGRVVFISSIAGVTGVPQEAVYAATKAGLTYFAESLRYELAGTGLGVSVVVPGVIDTPFFAIRGKPYTRSRPAPISAQRVARAVVTAIEKEQPMVFVPRWLRFPAWVHGAAPGAFRALAARFGQV